MNSAHKTAVLVCSFGTPWLDHFPPPIGTGRGRSSLKDGWWVSLKPAHPVTRPMWHASCRRAVQ